MRNNRSKLYLVIAMFVVVVLGIGYAYLTSKLTIEGNMEISGNTWTIFFENIVVQENDTSSELPVLSSDNSSITFSPKLNLPGDTYKFSVDITNDGTIDAMIKEIVISGLNTEQEKLIDYTVTYADGSDIKKYNPLLKNSNVNIVITVKFKDDITAAELPSTKQTFNLKLDADYVQYDDELVNTVEVEDETTDNN